MRAGSEDTKTVVPIRQAAVLTHVPVKECLATRRRTVPYYAVLADPAVNDTITAELVDQLKAQYVTDYYVVRDGENNGQVALGMYREKPYAEERLEELSSMGFRARLDVRSKIETEPDCDSDQQFADTEK